MSPDKSQQLFEQFDFLYRGRHLPPTQNLMGFSFECDDGWYDLICELSQQLEDYRQQHPEAAELIVMQVKQKFGELRMYVQPQFAEVEGLIAAATERSRHCCEVTGGAGQLCQCSGYYQTLCSEVAAARGFTLVPPASPPSAEESL